MSGVANYPTTLDTDTEFYDVTDGVSAIIAAHHNNIKEAVKALEQRVGVYASDAPTSLDYRIGNPTGAHSHNGASGQGPMINPTSLYPADEGDGYIRRILAVQHHGTAIVGSNVMAPIIMGRTVQLESIQAALRVGPSGATLAFDINLNQPTPVSVFSASQGLRPIFTPGATAFRSSPYSDTVTIPSGAIMTVDVDTVGSSEPGNDVGFSFVFRE